MIVFRSGMGTWEHVAGMDFTENARALFEYMLSQNYNHKYEMVWLVKYPERYRNIEQNNANVHFVSYDWATQPVRQRETPTTGLSALPNTSFSPMPVGSVACPERARSAFSFGMAAVLKR